MLLASPTRGVALARVLAAIGGTSAGHAVDQGSLDPTFYRGRSRTGVGTRLVEALTYRLPIEGPVSGVSGPMTLIFTADHACCTWRPCNLGPTRSGQRCCNVDRGHRELPIQPGLLRPDRAHQFGRRTSNSASRTWMVRVFAAC